MQSRKMYAGGEMSSFIQNFHFYSWIKKYLIVHTEKHMSLLSQELVNSVLKFSQLVMSANWGKDLRNRDRLILFILQS